METVYRDFAPKGVQFFYVYKALAHPQTNGYVRPVSLAERLKHVQEAEKRLGSAIPWICDSMANELKHELGNRPNSEFVVGPDLTIVQKRSWSSPSALRADLEKLVGPVENPTSVRDLGLKTIPPPKVAATGVVPRIEMSGRFQPIVSTATSDTVKKPYYVKLRAEVEDGYFRSGKGRLYLGFHLDPLYRVHWNNLVDPISFRITNSQGITVSPETSQGPKVEQPSDIDPREFLVEVSATAADQEARFELEVSYFACNDEEGWCKPVTQSYMVTLEQDRDAGRVMRNNFGRRRFAAGPGRRRGQSVMGAVREVTERLLKVQTRDRSEREFVVSADTKVIRQGQSGDLRLLQPGDRVVVQLQPNRRPNAPPTVVRILARSAP